MSTSVTFALVTSIGCFIKLVFMYVYPHLSFTIKICWTALKTLPAVCFTSPFNTLLITQLLQNVPQWPNPHYTSHVIVIWWTFFFHRWRGSLYKLLWREFVIFVTSYFSLSFTYRFVLDEQRKRSVMQLQFSREIYSVLWNQPEVVIISRKWHVGRRTFALVHLSWTIIDSDIALIWYSQAVL